MGSVHFDSESADIICPIAFDLSWSGNEVIVGPGTKKACDQAVEEALKSIAAGRQPIILLTPTHAGPEYGQVLMLNVMDKYIRPLLPPEARLLQREASEFTTAGEVVAVVDFLTDQGTTNKYQVIFCVKDWLALRVFLLAHVIASTRVMDIRFIIRTHPVPVSLKTRLLEWPKCLLVFHSAYKALANT